MPRHGGRAEQDARLHLGRLWPGERRHLDATPTSTGTHLRMEQAGFRPDQQQAYGGAEVGWPRFFASLEQVLARME